MRTLLLLVLASAVVMTVASVSATAPPLDVGAGSGALDVLRDVQRAVAGFLLPPPLSPTFQRGGALEGWNEDAVITVGVMLVLAIVDVALVRPLLPPGARYFALHAVANAIAAVAAAPDVYRVVFGDTVTAFSGPSSTMLGNSAVAAIHLYHCVAFHLTAADVFHHLTFVVILCGMAVPWKHVGGCANNFGVFFLSGAPGGVDYCLLVCVKLGWMHKMTEKRLNAWINQWVRGPAMTVYLAVGWLNWRSGSIHATIPDVAIALSCLLHFTNGAHYAREAIEGHAVHKEREDVASGRTSSNAQKKEKSH
jgi:hypothetical protein